MKFKTLFIITLAIVAMFAVGWISFSSSDTEANIRIDTQEIKKDADKAIEKGKELINDAKDVMDDATTENDVGEQSTPNQTAESDGVGGTPGVPD